MELERIGNILKMIEVLCIVKVIKMVRIYLTKARKISLKLSTKHNSA